jgi:hypothetical protein
MIIMAGSMNLYSGNTQHLSMSTPPGSYGTTVETPPSDTDLKKLICGDAGFFDSHEPARIIASRGFDWSSVLKDLRASRAIDMPSFVWAGLSGLSAVNGVRSFRAVQNTEDDTSAMIDTTLCLANFLLVPTLAVGKIWLNRRARTIDNAINLIEQHRKS